MSFKLKQSYFQSLNPQISTNTQIVSHKLLPCNNVVEFVLLKDKRAKKKKSFLSLNYWTQGQSFLLVQIVICLVNVLSIRLISPLRKIGTVIKSGSMTLH